MKFRKVEFFLLISILFLFGSCNGIPRTQINTPFPTEYLPTMVALTLNASGIDLSTPEPSDTILPTLASKATQQNYNNHQKTQ
jgi:hypothetical protein